MSRENLVLLVGIVQTIPIYDEKRDRTSYEVEVINKSKRRDTPMVRAFGKPGKISQEFEPGDLVFIKGVLTEKDIRRVYICPNCGHQKKTSKSVVEVVAVENTILKKSGEVYDIKTFSETSNVVKLIGTVVKPPQKLKLTGTKASRTTLAVDRKLKVKGSDLTCDYPFVLSYGKLCDSTLEHLRKGSLIYVNGTIQTRNSKVKTTCAKCNCQFEYETFSREVVALSIEYLSNCNFSKQGKDAEEIRKEDEKGLKEFLLDNDIDDTVKLLSTLGVTYAAISKTLQVKEEWEQKKLDRRKALRDDPEEKREDPDDNTDSLPEQKNDPAEIKDPASV